MPYASMTCAHHTVKMCSLASQQCLFWFELMIVQKTCFIIWQGITDSSLWKWQLTCDISVPCVPALSVAFFDVSTTRPNPWNFGPGPYNCSFFSSELLVISTLRPCWSGNGHKVISGQRHATATIIVWGTMISLKLQTPPANPKAPSL